jgi:ferredoxin, 2Fe-2S
MPRVIFRLPQGENRQIDVPVGESLMHGAVSAGIDQIEAECGGALTCATCHVHVEDGWSEKLVPADLAEVDLLEMVEDYRPESRLSCQIVMRDDLDGIVVAIP